MSNSIKNKVPRFDKWQCKTCNSERLLCSVWINMNTGEVLDGEGAVPDLWCENCQAFIDVVCTVKYDD